MSFHGRSTLALGLVLVLSLCGCSKKSGPTQPAPSESAASLVRRANVRLGQIISHQLDPSTDHTRPSDIDLTEPLGLYQQALAKDPANLDAHLGVAVLEILTLTSDTEVNAAFDEWKAYLTAHTPFELPLPSPGPMGVPARFGRGRDVLRLPFEGIPMATLAISRAAILAGDPQISRVQAILELRALPRLARALAHLQTVAATPGYRFVVSPEMQGDPSADPAELDATDFHALRAACGLLAATCDVAIAYELGFAAYDSSSLVNSIAPGGAWLKLRTGGAGRLNEAHALILGAVDDVDQAIVSLLAESDPQDDDVIKIGPDDLSRAEVDSVLTNLGNARTALTTGITLTEDWDLDPSTPPVPLEVHPGEFLLSPVADFKALLPGYSASAVRRTYSRLYHFGDGDVTRTVTIPSAGVYTASGLYNAYAGQPPSQYLSGDPALVAAIQEVIQSRLTHVQNQPNWTGDVFVLVESSSFLPAGTQSVEFKWHSSYYTSTRDVAVPVITWNAATFEAWQFPDPTLGGLLPGITSTSQLWNTFGITSGGWDQVLVLDWTRRF